MFGPKQKIKSFVSDVFTASFTGFDQCELLLKSLSSFNESQRVLKVAQGVEVGGEVVCFHFGAKGFQWCLVKLLGKLIFQEVFQDLFFALPLC